MSKEEQDNGSHERRREGEAILLEGRIAELEASKRKQQEQETTYKNRQLLFNFLLVVVGAATVGIYAYQAFIMNASLKAAKDSTDAATSAAKTAKRALEDSSGSFAETLAQMKAQSKAAQDAANASERSADNGSRALNNATVASHRDLRPYVSLRAMRMSTDPLEGKPFQAIVEIINTGRTPAINLEGCATLKPLTIPVTDDAPCEGDKNREYSHLVLGSGWPISIVTQTTTFTTDVAKVRPVIEAGGLRLYVYGYISYTDLLSPVVHRTSYCGLWSPTTKSFDVCEKHNHMD